MNFRKAFLVASARRTRIDNADRCVGQRFCFRGVVFNPARYPHSILRSQVDACRRIAESRGFPSQAENADYRHADFQADCLASIAF